MNRVKRLVSTIEHLISTKTKQHIVGGLLFSAAVFLGALSATVLTMRVEAIETDPVKEDRDDYHEPYEDDIDEY